MVSVSSRPEALSGEHERIDVKERPRRGRTLGQLVAAWSDRDAALPVAVVLSVFDDLLQDMDEELMSRSEAAASISLTDIHLDEHGVASLRGRAVGLLEISSLLHRTLAAAGEDKIPLAVRGLLRMAEAAEPPMEPVWFRNELRRTLGPPGSRAEVRAIALLSEAEREVASLIPAEALLDSVRPSPEAEVAHATFVDPTRPEEPVSVLERMSEPPAPATAPETFDLEPAAEPEPLEDEAPTERPSPASARPGASNWADSIQSSVPEAAEAPNELSLDPPTELVTAAAPEPWTVSSPDEAAFEVEAQTQMDLDEPSKVDEARPVVRLEPPRPRPVSLTFAPAARLRTSAPPDEAPSRIRIPAEERGRAWAILVFSLVVGLVAAWALGYLP